MKRLDLYLERLFGCFAAFLGALMAMSASYSSSVLLGNIMGPILIGILCLACVYGCVVISNRWMATWSAFGAALFFVSIFLGYTEKIRGAFLQLPQALPLDLSFVGAVMLFGVPGALIAAGLVYKLHPRLTAKLGETAE